MVATYRNESNSNSKMSKCKAIRYHLIFYFYFQVNVFVETLIKTIQAKLENEAYLMNQKLKTKPWPMQIQIDILSDNVASDTKAKTNRFSYVLKK